MTYKVDQKRGEGGRRTVTATDKGRAEPEFGSVHFPSVEEAENKENGSEDDGEDETGEVLPKVV